MILVQDQRRPVLKLDDAQRRGIRDSTGKATNLQMNTKLLKLSASEAEAPLNMTTPCRKCGTPIEQQDSKFCPSCGTPISTALLVRHKDAVGLFAHHESVLQNYRSLFLVSETFSVSLAATRLDNRSLVLLFASFGITLLIVWIIVTTLRAGVVEFFEQHDEEGALMQYHNTVEGFAHRAGFWFFTVIFPAAFALFWMGLILLAYGIIRIG